MVSLRELDEAGWATFDRAMGGSQGARRLHIAVGLLHAWLLHTGRYRIDTGWTETSKLRTRGDAHRDRLLAARLNLRS